MSTGSDMRSFDAANPRDCISVIARLPLTNTREAHQALLSLLAAMERTPPPATAYLEVLEAARAPAAFVQEELAQRYAAKPLPPTASEDEAFLQVLSLWHAMARAYAQVAHLGTFDTGTQSHLALICQRCVHFAGRIIFEHFRARREPAQGAWMEFHGYYATAEEWGIASVTVAEPLSEPRKTQSAAEAYASILLVDLASPYSRKSRELSWIARWALRFAQLTAILPAEPDVDPRAFGIDLMQDSGARPLGTLPQSDSVRRFDTARIGPELQQLLAQLKQNVSPAELGLGSDCPLGAGSRLLLNLYRPWCLHATPRRFQRREASGIARVGLGFDAIHFHVTGVEFNQPEHVRMYSRAEMETIWTFRDQIDPTQQLKLRATQAQLGYPLENWEIADQSVSGFRLQRSCAGARLEHDQLVCIKPHDGEHFLLARIGWCQMLKDNTDLLLGVHIMPGVPQGISIRPTGIAVSRSEHYVRAFLLPPMTALKEPGSLVVPHGWFQPGRVIEVYTDRQARVRLDELLAQGADFERVSYTRL